MVRVITVKTKRMDTPSAWPKASHAFCQCVACSLTNHPDHSLYAGVKVQVASFVDIRINRLVFCPALHTESHKAGSN